MSSEIEFNQASRITELKTYKLNNSLFGGHKKSLPYREAMSSDGRSF